MTEEELENFSPIPANPAGVAIVNKHASLEVGVKHPFNTKPSPSKGLSGKEAMAEIGKGYSGFIQDPSASNVISDVSVEGGSRPVSPVSPTKNLKGSSVLESQAGDSKAEHPAPAKNLDKINNLVQKEIALGRVGVTREKAYKVIASALDAHKWMDVVDRQGNVKQEWVPDIEKQRWGAEMAIKMFGDMIERKEVEYDVGDKTLDRLRSLSVAELKSRAADILLGKKTVITDAEVVHG